MRGDGVRFAVPDLAAGGPPPRGAPPRGLHRRQAPRLRRVRAASQGSRPQGLRRAGRALGALRGVLRPRAPGSLVLRRARPEARRLDAERAVAGEPDARRATRPRDDRVVLGSSASTGGPGGSRASTTSCAAARPCSWRPRFVWVVSPKFLEERAGASQLVVFALVAAAFVCGSRASYRLLQDQAWKASTAGQPVLIYGAGNAGIAALRELQRNPERGMRPVGFLDDDPRLQGKTVSGFPVVGSYESLETSLRTGGRDRHRDLDGEDSRGADRSSSDRSRSGAPSRSTVSRSGSTRIDSSEATAADPAQARDLDSGPLRRSLDQMPTA